MLIKLLFGDGVADWIKASVVTHTGAGSNLGLRVAFFFKQFTVSGEKCGQPPPGHGRYPQVPNEKSAKLYNTIRPLQIKNKQI